MNTKANVTVGRLFELAGIEIPQDKMLCFDYRKERFYLNPCPVVFVGDKFIRDPDVWHEGKRVGWWEIQNNFRHYPKSVIMAFLSLPDGVWENGNPAVFDDSLIPELVK